MIVACIILPPSAGLQVRKNDFILWTFLSEKQKLLYEAWATSEEVAIVSAMHGVTVNSISCAP